MTVAKPFIEKLDAARKGQGHAQSCPGSKVDRMTD